VRRLTPRAGARWGTFPTYFVNVATVPDGLDAGQALTDLQAAHSAWEDPWTTDCSNIRDGMQTLGLGDMKGLRARD
jgi:hypothetical protein